MRNVFLVIWVGDDKGSGFINGKEDIELILIWGVFEFDQMCRVGEKGMEGMVKIFSWSDVDEWGFN